MERHTAEREGISQLSAPILHHILSFLSLEESVKTCVLSKSWRHLGSTRPKFVLWGSIFRGGEEKFVHVLEKSLQVYSDQKLCIEYFSVSKSMAGPELVSLLKKWIPILINDIGVKKIDLSICTRKPEIFDLPSAVFESETLQELYLFMRCSLSQINCIGNSNSHLKKLHLQQVYIEEESFGKIMSSCRLVEDLSLVECKGFTTIDVHNHHNLKRFNLHNNKKNGGRSIEIYLPSGVENINIGSCPNCLQHRDYFPGLTCLELTNVPLSNGWFNSLSRNFPCLEELWLLGCFGFDEFQLSSRSIKNLFFTMDESTTIKATIDTPSIKLFTYDGPNIPQSISFSTTPGELNSQTRLLFNRKDVSLCFLKLSLTCLYLDEVALSDEWFDSFSHNLPCLEELQLCNCSGFDELKLSSRSIKTLDIAMHESTNKAIIDAPSIKKFYYDAKISQSISFITATTSSSDWSSQIHLSLDLDSSLWFLKISELVAEFSQSQINSLVLRHSGRGNQHIEHLSDISVCCSGSYKMPVELKSLDLNLDGLYYDSFFSDLMNGLFRVIHPSEIKQNWYFNAQKDHERKRNEAVEFLCRTVQMGKSEDDEGMSFWHRELEEVSLQVDNGGLHEEWHPVEGTTSWSEYVAALLPPLFRSFCELRFRLKWRE